MVYKGNGKRIDNIRKKKEFKEMCDAFGLRRRVKLFEKGSEFKRIGKEGY